MVDTKAMQEKVLDKTVTLQRTFEDNALARWLYGEKGSHLKTIERAFRVNIQVRGNEMYITGDPVDTELADRTCEQLYGLLKQGYTLYPSDVEFATRIISENPRANLKDIFLETVFVSSGRKVITPKSINQKLYIDAIRNHDIVFGVGPAGTGKTYLAMAMAISFFMRGEIQRIVLVRPAVEAGEKLGFLPGDLIEKVNPYLRPLYDALYDMLPFDKASRLIQKGVIEVAPLAFMRGRTLNEAFIILDEAQNTTSDQMKMFLTRLGYSSRAVITGDITQIDLPDASRSGLVEAVKILQGIEGIAFIFFNKKDVVRHPLVQRIIEAYERREQEKKELAQ